MLAERVQEAFAALDGQGDAGVFRDLFVENAQWLGVPLEGFTPV